MSRRRRQADPAASGGEPALDRLKFEVAQEIGLLPEAPDARSYERFLDDWKYEIADELGLRDKIRDVGWGELTARECGKIGGRMGGHIGGQMVRRMVEYAEENMKK